MSIQSVIIDRNIYDLTEAIHIITCILHLPMTKVHTTTNHFRFRILPPDPTKRYWTEEDTGIGGVKYIMFI